MSRGPGEKWWESVLAGLGLLLVIPTWFVLLVMVSQPIGG